MGLALPLEVQIAAAGLPRPVKEWGHNPSRRWRWDYAWGEPYRLLVDIQGAIWTQGRHTRGKGYQNDCEKHNDAILQGYRVLWLTTQDVASGKALETIRQALQERTT